MAPMGQLRQLSELRSWQPRSDRPIVQQLPAHAAPGQDRPPNLILATGHNDHNKVCRKCMFMMFYARSHHALSF